MTNMEARDRETSLDNVKINYVSNLDELWQMKTWLSERRRVLGFDTETGGLNPYSKGPDGKLRLIQFGDEDNAWCIPWKGWERAVTEMLYGYEGDIVLHNAPFDIRFMTVNTGKPWPHWRRTHDTMLQVHLDDSSKSKKLKPTCARFFGNEAVAGQDALDEAMTKNKWTWATIPENYPLYWAYGGLDTILTARLDRRLRPGVEKLYSGPYDLEREVQRICTNMSLRGMRVDREYVENKIKQLTQYAESVRKWCHDEFNVANIGSAAQLIDRFKSDGVEFHKLTPGGKIAMDKEVLTALSQTHPLAQQVLRVKHAEKIIGSYLNNFLELMDDNGYVHCSIHTVGAKTGRMSISDPALQTLHREDKVVRGSIIASEGNSLVKCDADQIEARMMASLSRDAGLIRAFEEEGDFFCKIASQIHSVEINDKADPRRQTSKNALYSLQYGAGVTKMAETAGIPLEEMMPIRESMKNAFSGMFEFIDKVQSVAKTRTPPHVFSHGGRRLVGMRGSEYQLVNYLIQCGAAEILKRNLVELDSAGMGESLVLPVHDEIIVDVPEDESEDAARILEETMYDNKTYVVPITWGAEVLGKSWGKR